MGSVLPYFPAHEGNINGVLLNFFLFKSFAAGVKSISTTKHFRIIVNQQGWVFFPRFQLVGATFLWQHRRSVVLL